MTRGGWHRGAKALGLAAAAAAALALSWSGWRAARPGPGGPAPAWPDPPRLTFEPGVERAYQVEVKAEGRAESGAPGDRTAFALGLDGLLALRAYPGAGEVREIGARLVGPRLRLDGQVPAYAAALEVPFSFGLDAQGQLTGLTFPPRLPSEAAALLSQLVTRLEVVLPHERRLEWRTRERDAAGLFRAAYRVDPAAPLRIEKRRLEYLPVQGGDPPPRVLESLATFELEPELRGVRSVEGSEVLARRGGELEGREAVAFRYALSASPRALPDTWAELAALRDAAWAPPAGAGPAPGPEIPGAEAVGEVLRRFGDAFAGDRRSAEALAAAWLLRPGAPRALVLRLEAMDREPGQASLEAAPRAVLWRLLAHAGTPEAEAALLDAAVQPAHAARTRRQAIGHLGEVVTARPAMVAGLLAVYDAAGAGPEEAGLREMALLAAGALGHPGVADAALGQAVARALDERLARSADPAARLAVLEAMGNAGEPCLPALRAALADPDPGQRAAAVGGFRRMEGPEARRILRDHVDEEADPAVRARAVEVLRRLAVAREQVTWAAALAAHEADPRVLLALVDLLGASPGGAPAARAALQELRRTATDSAVRNRILRYLPPGG